MEPQIKKIQLQKEYYFEEGCFINELSNSLDDADVSIARARVESGKTTKWHALAGVSERYVIQAGCGEVEIDDLPAQAVTAGDVVLIPPMTRQRIKNVGKTDLVFLAICSPPFVESAYRQLER